MKAVLMLLGIVCLIAGLLFAAQGAGILPWPQSSFMVNRVEWILYGLVIAGVGLILVGIAARRRT